MAQSNLAEELATVEPRQFVRLNGYPEHGDETRWHMNKAAQIGTGGGTVRHAIVLQKADASEHWIAGVILSGDGEPEFDTLAAFEDAMPAGGGLDDVENSLDPESISVVAIEDEK